MNYISNISSASEMYLDDPDEFSSQSFEASEENVVGAWAQALSEQMRQATLRSWMRVDNSFNSLPEIPRILSAISQPRPVDTARIVAILRSGYLLSENDVEIRSRSNDVDGPPKGQVAKQLVISARGQAEQFSFDVTGGFVPSESLLNAWKDAASTYSIDGLDRAKPAEASALFLHSFKRLVGAFAQEKRSLGQQCNVLIDETGLFNVDFQLDISDRFLLMPQRSSKFFDLLYRDLLQSSSSIVVTGAWGELKREGDGKFVINLTPRNKVSSSDFVKARKVR